MASANCDRSVDTAVPMVKYKEAKGDCTAKTPRQRNLLSGDPRARRLRITMPINRDKPDRWKSDISASVDQFNQWFMEFAPATFRATRLKTAEQVEESLRVTKDFSSITSAFLSSNPKILQTLRMATCPPIARDRLSGLAAVSKSIMQTLEAGKLPARLPAPALGTALEKIVAVINQLLDRDIFPWLAFGRSASKTERH